MLVGVVAHTNQPSGRLQNTPPPYLPAIMAAAGRPRMALLRAVKRVRSRFLDGDFQAVCIWVIELYDAVQLLPGGGTPSADRGWRLAQLPLRESNVMAIAVHQAAPGPTESIRHLICVPTAFRFGRWAKK